MSNATRDPPLIEAHGLGKSYGPVEALAHVDLVIRRGEVVGVAGDNGAGKSTLMKIVAGAIGPTSGTLFCDGEPVREYSPLHARRLGIDMVYQDLSLCDNLSVAENVFLGRELRRRSRLGVAMINTRGMAQRADELLRRLGLELKSVLEPVSILSGGQRQAVAISRALAFDPKMVILDEPTAALSVSAAKPLLEMIRNLPRQGASVMLVSHRLSDLLETTDRVYVLRHGRIAAELVTSMTTEEELLRLMAGLGTETSGEKESSRPAR
jgi:ABC-type sugar transport system ATPase subunit